MAAGPRSGDQAKFRDVATAAAGRIYEGGRLDRRLLLTVGVDDLKSPAPDGQYRRDWFREDVGSAEIAFEADVYLLTKSLAEKLKSTEITPVPPSGPEPTPPETPATPECPHPDGITVAHAIISVAGSISPEQWNRLGTRLLPKMRAAGTVTATIRLEIEIEHTKATALSAS